MPITSDDYQPYEDAKKCFENGHALIKSYTEKYGFSYRHAILIALDEMHNKTKGKSNRETPNLRIYEWPQLFCEIKDKTTSNIVTARDKEDVIGLLLSLTELLAYMEGIYTNNKGNTQ